MVTESTRPARRASSRRTAGVTFRVGVAGVLVAVLVLRLWSVSRWSWMFDDWVYMSHASSMGLFDFLFQNYNGHVMPGEFLIVRVVTALAPLSHGPVVVLTALGATAATAVWALALRELCGERLRTLALLALVGLSPLHIQATIWWAAALQTVSLQAALGGCVYFAARLARDERRVDRVGLLATFAAGLLFWEKSAAIIVPVAAVMLYLAPRDSRWRRAVRETGWLVGLTAAYAVLFVAVTRQPSTLPSENRFVFPAVDVLLDSFGDLVGDLLAPSLLGGPWGTLPTDSDIQAHPSAWVVALALGAVVGGLVLVLRRRRAAWVPLAMVVLYGSVSWGLVVLTRLDIMRLTQVGYERYAVDTFLVACLALALYLTPEAVRTPAERRPPRSGLPAGPVLVAALSVSLAVANIVAVHRIGISPARSWVRHVTAGVERHRPVTLVDGIAPDKVLFAPFWGANAQLSHMLAPFGEDVRFDRPAAKLLTLTPSGRLAPFVLTAAARSKPGPVAQCGYAVGPGDSVRLPMSTRLYRYRWVLQLHAFTSTPGSIVVDVDGHRERFAIKAGLNAPATVFTGTVNKVRVTDTSTSGVICLTDVMVGSTVSATP